MQLTNSIKQTEAKIQSLQAEMQKLGNTKVPTQEYTDVQNQVTATESKLNSLIAKKEEFFSSGGNVESLAFKKMDLQIEELTKSIPYLKSELQELVNTGNAFTPGTQSGAYAKKAQQLSSLNDKLSLYNSKLSEAGKKESSTASKLGTMLKSAKKGFTTLGNVAKKAFDKISAGSKKSSGMFGTFASRLKGIALSLLVFNWISKGWNAMMTTVKDGVGKMAQYSSSFNASMSSLKTATSTLKNSLVAAFSPIISMIIPYLVKLCDWLTRACNLINAFFSALSGKSTMTVAVKTSKDYAAGLTDTAKAADKAKKALEGYLSPIDEINKYQTNKDDTASSGSGGSGVASDLWKEVPLKLSNFMQQLLDAIKNDDWYKVGELLAHKINEQLASIKWDKIKKSAKKIATNIGNFINGFCETLNWNLLGYTLGEGINTAVIFLQTLIDTIHWGPIANKISNGLNSMTKTIDWKAIGHLFATGITSAFTFLYEFVKTYDFRELAKSITTSLNTFISDTDWETVGKAIGACLQSAIDFVSTFITTIKYDEVVKAIQDLFKGFFEEVDKEKLAIIIAAVLGATILSGFLKIKMSEIAITWVSSKFAPAIATALGGTVATEAVSTGVLGSATAGLTGITAAELATGAIAFATNLLAAIGAALIGLEIGFEIQKKFEESLGNEPMFNDLGEMWDYLCGMSFEDVKGGFKEWGKAISQAFHDGLVAPAWNGWGKGIEDEEKYVSDATTVNCNSIQKTVTDTTTGANVAASTNFAQMRNNVYSSTNSINGATNGMTKNTEASVNNMASSTKKGMNSMDSSINTTKQNTEKLSTSTSNSANSINRSYDKTKSGADSMKKSVSSSMNGIDSSTEKTKNNVTKFGDSGNSAMDRFKNAVKSMYDSVIGWFADLGDEIGGLLDKLKNLGDKSKEVRTSTSTQSIQAAASTYSVSSIGTTLPMGVSNYINSVSTSTVDNTDTILSAIASMKEALRSTGGDGGTQTINLVMDGMTLAQVVIKAGKIIQMRTGSNPFVTA